MTSTELDTTLLDAQGDSIPAVSMPGGTKLPGSAVVFRRADATDVPVSEDDPMPVAGVMGIDPDQQTALLGQIAAVTAAVEDLAESLSTAVDAGLIALDDADYPTLAAAPGVPFGDLLGFAAATEAHVASLAGRFRVPYTGLDYAAAFPLGDGNADVTHMTLTGDITSFVNPSGTNYPGSFTVIFVQDGDGGHAIASGAEDAGSATVVWAVTAPYLTPDDPDNSTAVRFTQIGTTKWLGEVLYQNQAP